MRKGRKNSQDFWFLIFWSDGSVESDWSVWSRLPNRSSPDLKLSLFLFKLLLFPQPQPQWKENIEYRTPNSECRSSFFYFDIRHSIFCGSLFGVSTPYSQLPTTHLGSNEQLPRQTLDEPFEFQGNQGRGDGRWGEAGLWKYSIDPDLLFRKFLKNQPLILG